MEITLKVSGMHCKSCGILLSDAVSEIKGVRDVVVDFKAGTVRFSCDNEDAVALVRDAIEAEGYGVVG